MLALEIESDREDPGAELRALAEVVSCSVQVQEGLLHELRGVALVPDLAPHETEEPGGVAFEQRLEGPLVSGAVRRHQLLVGRHSALSPGGARSHRGGQDTSQDCTRSRLVG